MTAKSYKSKRSGNDRFLTYLFVGIGGLIVALILGLIVYSAFHEELTYDSFDHIENYSGIMAQSESEYLVYYYSETCSHCNQIKSQVLNFAHSNNADLKVYFLPAQNIGTYNTTIKDPDSGQTMEGTPSMITIINGQVADLTVGDQPILDLITTINDGSYAFLN